MFFRHVTTRVSMWESDCHIISAKKGNVKNVLLGVLPLRRSETLVDVGQCHKHAEWSRGDRH